MSLAALILALTSLAFVASVFAVGARQLRALVRVHPQPLTEPLLVVIPARNEVARIEPTLRALLAEPSPTLAVVVVDDRSTDDTAAVVARIAATDPRARCLQLDDDPPPGTFGKPRALAAAVDDARARGVLPARVLFLDADVALAPGALGAVVEAATTSGADALSGVPRLVCESAAEAMLVPALASVVTGRFAPTRVHDDADPTAFLNGQLILVTTAALDDVGGWRALTGTVLEDVALARALKAKHKRLRIADLRAVAATRMYDSLAAIDEGFGKNAVALLGRSAGAIGAFSLAMSLLPWTAAALALSALPAPAAIAAIAAVACGAAVQALARRMAGAPVWPVVVLPLVYAGVAGVLVRASWRAARRAPIAWRGRRYRADGE